MLFLFFCVAMLLDERSFRFRHKLPGSDIASGRPGDFGWYVPCRKAPRWFCKVLVPPTFAEVLDLAKVCVFFSGEDEVCVFFSGGDELGAL